jgi:hypothetical protein
VTAEWPDERLERLRLAAVEQELVQVTKELETRTRQLEAAKRQIADLKRLFEVRKRVVPSGTAEISDYYLD